MRREHYFNAFVMGIFLFGMSCSNAIATTTQTVIINEINWNGTEISSSDEWIELYNTSEENVILDNWTLNWNNISIDLTGLNITSTDFILLERTNDDTVPEINADLIYTGSLRNSGENIILKSSDEVIDIADFSTGWPETDYITTTLERYCTDLSIWKISTSTNGSPKQLNTICVQEDDEIIIDPDPTPDPEPDNILEILGTSCQHDKNWNCTDEKIEINLTKNLFNSPIGNNLNYTSSTQIGFDMIKIDHDSNDQFDLTIFIFHITDKVIAIAKNWLFFGIL